MILITLLVVLYYGVALNMPVYDLDSHGDFQLEFTPGPEDRDDRITPLATTDFDSSSEIGYASLPMFRNGSINWQLFIAGISWHLNNATNNTRVPRPAPVPPPTAAGSTSIVPVMSLISAISEISLSDLMRTIYTIVSVQLKTARRFLWQFAIGDPLRTATSMTTYPRYRCTLGDVEIPAEFPYNSDRSETVDKYM